MLQQLHLIGNNLSLLYCRFTAAWGHTSYCDSRQDTGRRGLALRRDVQLAVGHISQSQCLMQPVCRPVGRFCSRDKYATWSPSVRRLGDSSSISRKGGEDGRYLPGWLRAKLSGALFGSEVEGPHG